MDFIPFEKVSLQEAKAVLDGSDSPAPGKNWTSLRQSLGITNKELTEKAMQWLQQLPAEVQPGGLVQQFPRITNKLADLWARPLYCERYLDALLLDNRDRRTGFPPDVAKE